MQMGNKDPERPRCLLAGRFHHQQHRHYAPHGNAGWLWPEEQDTCRATGPAAASSGAASSEELGPEIRFRVLASWAKAVINHRLLRTHRASRNTHRSRSSQDGMRTPLAPTRCARCWRGQAPPEQVPEGLKPVGLVLWHCREAPIALHLPEGAAHRPSSRRDRRHRALQLLQRLLDPQSTDCTTPYLETKTGNRDT